MSGVDWVRVVGLAVAVLCLVGVGLIEYGRRRRPDKGDAEEYPGQRAYEEHKRLWREPPPWEDTHPANRQGTKE